MAHNYQLIDNQALNQYQFNVDGLLPRIEYLKTQDKIYLTHTEVPAELGGNGIGSALVHKALQDIEEKGLTLIPLCPFVAMYIKKHPEWRKLVFKGIHIK